MAVPSCYACVCVGGGGICAINALDIPVIYQILQIFYSYCQSTLLFRYSVIVIFTIRDVKQHFEGQAAIAMIIFIIYHVVKTKTSKLFFFNYLFIHLYNYIFLCTLWFHTNMSLIKHFGSIDIVPVRGVVILNRWRSHWTLALQRKQVVSRLK